jgi:hypothetical protein
MITAYHTKYIAHALTRRCATNSRDMDRQKYGLLDEIGRRLEHKAECSDLFTACWRVA